MKLVLTLHAPTDADEVDAHLAFHLNAGVDLVLATGQGASGAAVEVLESYERGGFVRIVRAQDVPEAELATRMARLAVTEHDADWIIDSSHDEFWWPRAEGLKDALVAIPPRYNVVQALVRRFVGRVETGSLAEHLAVRHDLGVPHDGEPLPPAALLRSVYRATSQLTILPRGVTVDAWRVPLRAWYPIEVFAYRGVSLADEEIERGLSSGSLVEDTRLVAVLAQLRDAGLSNGARFARPVPGAAGLVLPVPDVVDDALYAVECAAVGEVNLDRLDRQIRDLEQRIASLEARFWPRVQRTLRRLARRRR